MVGNKHLLKIALAFGGICGVIFASSGNLSCAKPKLKIFSQGQVLLDTFVEISVVALDEQTANTAIAAAYAEMRRLEQLLSRYVPESQIAAVNRQAGQPQIVAVDAEVRELTRRALRYAEMTNGGFDVTIGPVIDVWGIGTEREHVPTPADLQQALQLVDYRKVAVTETGIRLQEQGMSLDLGGIAKGFIVDRAAATLQQQGIQQALVNAGGNIRCLGSKPDGSPWRIGIQHPREKDKILGVVELRNAAVATSGDYQRFFMQNDTRYHHIFDPRTGAPVRTCQSVTIIAPTAEMADALSTTVFVMGPEQGRLFLERDPDAEGMIVAADGQIITSSKFSYSTTP